MLISIARGVTRSLSHCNTRLGSKRLHTQSRRFSPTIYRSALSNQISEAQDASRIRNIGIIAHIDAGKTTTTERMLYYSGYTRRIGDVDDGSTVTDFLPAERARGITIQSAAITFHWPPRPSHEQVAPSAIDEDSTPKTSATHQINLIDTPGHADFTFEVRRCLRVLDGAVCILDAVAGVEAQTEQVWKQAGQWQIPRIAYINKLDRDGAEFARTVREVGVRLGGWPAVCQIPWWEGGRGRFTGIGDAINLQGLLYVQGGDGKAFKTLSLSQLESDHSELCEELARARVALVELLSEHDESMVDSFLEANEDHLAVLPSEILSCIRRVVLRPNTQLIPIFAGASFRNIGVQPLLDAVVDLLPSPRERPDAEVSLGAKMSSLKQILEGENQGPSRNMEKGKKKAVASAVVPLAQSFEGFALAFKVVNDPRKGMLVFFRVYSGSINRASMLYNTNLHVSERATNILRMYASDSVPVQSVEAGQIGVFAGSKHARTGDTLVAYHGNKSAPPEPLNQLQLRPIEVPPPVFFASIEPDSLREEKDMHDKLALLLREDPSLHVSQDEDTGQTLLSGMGELHLEIARDRLVTDLKAKATMGEIEIGYRETVNVASAEVSKIFDGEANAKKCKGKAGCTALAGPLSEESNTTDDQGYTLRQDGNVINVVTPTLDARGRPRTSEDPPLPVDLNLLEVQLAYVNGALAALGRGPACSYPMRNIRLTLTLDTTWHVFGNDTTLSALSSAARLATIAALKDATARGGSTMMEPVMDVTISVDEESMGNVINDISSSRGGHILSLGDDDGQEAGGDSRLAIDASKICVPSDPFGSRSTGAGSGSGTSRPRTVKAKVPLKEMVGYLKHLRSITGGRGTFVMSVDRFEKMGGQREKQVLAHARGFS